MYTNGCENNYDLENAAILRHGKIPTLEKELNDLKEKDKMKLLSDNVDRRMVAQASSTKSIALSGKYRSVIYFLHVEKFMLLGQQL